MVRLVSWITLVGLIGVAILLIPQATLAEDSFVIPTTYAFAEDLVADPTSDPPNCPVFTPACYCERPRFFFSAEALWLQLDHGTRDARPVVRDIYTRQPLLTTHDLNYNTAAGPRLGFGWHLNDCSSIEASYFGLQHWNAGRDISQDYPITPRMTLVDSTEARSAANLNSAEISYVRRVGDSNLSILTGFRYLNFGEDFTFARDFGLYYGANGVGLLGYDQSRNTQNYLFGWQTGARYKMQYGKLGLFLTGKAGIYGNSFSAHRTTDLEIRERLIPIVDETTRGTHAAFVGELGLNGIYQITRGWSFNAGYNLLWVDGIARAANQFNQGDWRVPDKPIAFGQGAFLHGANVGFSYNW